ncbi:MAG: nucleoside/nucleotide kinase family protein [Propionivibrio sp.]
MTDAVRMTSSAAPAIPESYLVRLREMLKAGSRKIIGLVGPPGAGKTTVSLALREMFGDISQIVPMDGFHLANVELARLGRAHRKGAPDTFDSAGYVDLLKRLRAQGPDEIIYAPEFRREIEEPIAGAIPIFPETQLLIAEGNYLLLEDGHWKKVSTYVDEIWYVDVDDDLRIGRLADRHVQFGRTRDEAVAWVNNTDEPNARLIEQGKHRANLLFRWDAE